MVFISVVINDIDGLNGLLHVKCCSNTKSSGCINMGLIFNSVVIFIIIIIFITIKYNDIHKYPGKVTL